MTPLPNWYWGRDDLPSIPTMMLSPFINKHVHTYPVNAQTGKYENRLETYSQKDKYECGRGRGGVTNLVGEDGQHDLWGPNQ